LKPRGFVAASLAGLLLLPACRMLAPRAPDGPSAEPAPLPVKKVDIEIVVAAWAEPARLPPGGGTTQILVRVQKRGGAPAAEVEVRLSISDGSLFSEGRVLVTDARGMTRDRLTSRRTTIVVLNAGGTRYSFRVPVEPKPE
jgi:hypothetical protein